MGITEFRQNLIIFYVCFCFITVLLGFTWFGWVLTGFIHLLLTAMSFLWVLLKFFKI